MTNAPAPLVCDSCHKPVSGYFRTERFNADGRSTIAVTTCSITCLLSWASQYALGAGVMIVGSAKSTLDKLLDAIRGPKR